MAKSSLPRGSDFARVFENGRARSNSFMVVYCAPREGGGRRLGLIVSNKVGTAVVRSRLKRVLREAFAEVARDWPDNCDYIIIARQGLRTLDENGGERAVAKRLRALAPHTRLL